MRSHCRYHAFDKETHRCKKCNRWERGYKPQKEFAKPRDECQICERQQALNVDGTLGNHGYKRPGWGFIEGNCFGVGHKPYPATGALVAYEQRLTRYLEKNQSLLNELPSLNEIAYAFQDRRSKERKSVVVRRGEHCNIHPEFGYLPSFEDLIKSEERRLTSEIRMTNQEITRVKTRIESAKQENKHG